MRSRTAAFFRDSTSPAILWPNPDWRVRLALLYSVGSTDVLFFGAKESSDHYYQCRTPGRLPRRSSLKFSWDDGYFASVFFFFFGSSPGGLGPTRSEFA